MSKRENDRKLTFGYVLVTTLMLWLTTGVASAALWPSYASPALVILVVVTTLAGSLIAILGAVFRWSSAAVMLVTMLGYLLLGVPLAIPTRAVAYVIPTVDGLRELVLATALSWKQLLTISLPVGSYQSLLVPAFTLVLSTVVISLSVALRARYAELGTLGPIVIFIVAIAFGPDSRPLPFMLAIGFLASVLLWLIWRRWYRRRELIQALSGEESSDGGLAQPIAGNRQLLDGGFVGFRTLASAALVVAIAGAAAFGATNLLPPTGERVVLRSTVLQRFDPRDYPSPLSGFRKYEQTSTSNRTILTVRDLPAKARIRLATLDSYDGIVYSVGSASVSSASGSFTRVPLTVDQSGVSGTEVTIEVTISDYSGVWLPTVGELEAVTFAGDDASTLLESFYFNQTSGSAAILSGLAEGDSYRLRVIIPDQPTRSQYSSLEPGSVELPPLGVIPDALATTLDGYVNGIVQPGARLVAMLDGLAASGYVSHGVSATEPPSRSGHAADRITELLTSQRMIGDQEQYAVTAAIMARQLGFPARVVFGFEPSEVDPNGETRVTGSDVSAWIEVNTTEYGWVAIDPTPKVRPIPEESPEDPTQAALPQSPVQPQLPDTQKRESQIPTNSSQDEVPAENPILTVVFRVLVWLGWVVLAATILLSPFLAIVAAKLRRRRLRRRAKTPLERISGGWDEFADAVLDRGFTPGPSPTRIEVAQVVGGTQPFVLAAVANRAIFAPGEPDDELADQLWRSVDELRYSLDLERTVLERIKALISLRSLGGYSVTSLFKR